MLISSFRYCSFQRSNDSTMSCARCIHKYNYACLAFFGWLALISGAIPLIFITATYVAKGTALTLAIIALFAGVFSAFFTATWLLFMMCGVIDDHMEIGFVDMEGSIFACWENVRWAPGTVLLFGLVSTGIAAGGFYYGSVHATSES
jgi:hypothetical protein